METQRLYHVIAVNDKTRTKVYLTRTPEAHDAANRILSKQPRRPWLPHLRCMLEEATSAAPSTSERVPHTGPRDVGVTGRVSR